MTNILKRQEYRLEIDGLKVKNPNIDQKIYIQNFINENYKISDSEDSLEMADDTLKTSTDLLIYMLKNLVEGIDHLTEEDLMEAIKDPSLTLRKINIEFNQIVSEITQETLMMTVTNLREAKLLSETNMAIEEVNTLLNQKSNEAKDVAPLKKKGRPKKK